jgi:spore protease
VLDEDGERLIGKPKGRYITADIPSFSADTELLDGRLDGVINELRCLIPANGSILVAGLGNRSMTADALGPECADRIFVTRHIQKELAESLGFRSLRSVAAISPGVLGETGMEAAEIIASIVKCNDFSCVIVIDALAAMDINRLGTTVQISDTGISPGSGIGNKRKEISRSTLGIPVISVGVPTVISAHTLADNILGTNTDITSEEKWSNYIVASSEADLITERASEFIALAVNCALQSEISAEDLMLLM